MCSKNSVIPNPKIKQVLYFNGNDITLRCHSETKLGISQAIDTKELEILHFVQNDRQT